MRPLKKYSIAFSSLFFLSAGNSQNLRCSSEEVIETVIKIAKDNYSTAGMASIYIDFEKTTIAVEAIRTRNRDKYLECAANIKFNIVMRENSDANVGSRNPVGTAIMKPVIERQINGPITYTVELTDDGKEFYVEIDGLKPL